jgi:hypothetical protein
LCQGDLGNFSSLQSLFVKLRHVPQRENKLSLLNVLRAYWIELHTLAGLADVIGGQAPRLVVVQTDRAPDSIDMCVERQYIPYGDMPEIIHIAGGNEPPQPSDVVAACRAVDQNPFAPSDDDAYRKMLQKDVVELQLRRVVLLPNMNDIDSAMELAAAFPMFSFIMPTTLDLQARARRAGAEWLSLKRPTADGRGEEDHTSDYYYALGRI